MTEKCSDFRCPVHGSIKVRGNTFTGIVVSTKAPKTVKIQRSLIRYIPKYERYKRVKSSIFAHLPECLKVSLGDVVKIGETRKLSKTKSFVVLSTKKVD